MDTRPLVSPFSVAVPASDFYAGGFCYVELPKAALGVIAGALRGLTANDAWIGSDNAVNLAMVQIEDIIVRLIMCHTCDSGIPPDNGNGNSNQGSGFGCDCTSESEECMSCSIPYGSMRLNESGVLQYKYCGEWYDVEGWVPLDDWTPDGGTDTEPPDEYTENTTACAKAIAWTDVLFGVVDKALDMAALQTKPFDFLGQLRTLYPAIAWGQLAVANVYTAALHIALLGYASETEDETTQQKMRCRVHAVMSEAPQGMTPAEYAATKSAITAVANEAWTILDYPTAYQSMRNIYTYAAQAIGEKDSAKITQYAQPVDGMNCLCPGDIIPEDEYDGVVRFTGSILAAQEPTWLANVHTENNGKRLLVTWNVPARTGGTWRSAEISTGLLSTQAIQSLSVLVFPQNSGDAVPFNNWFSSPCAEQSDPLTWVKPQIGATGWTYTQQALSGAKLGVNTHAGAAPVDIRLNSYHCPNLGSDTKTYRYVYEIVAINGVAV